ncbi:3-oxoacyl-reductase [Pleomassaria siparia CBS 279.74]|uniref:3-oxoacyl-reductase n=1 Tax=Pleomassaria siparia CBS 279.74 TaxID=1314801 RepID=A0A6G1KJU5_9PLEO|nr:3-oxoacyl-reductase [Pleomassaria siparia CBS 279.74]
MSAVKPLNIIVTGGARGIGRGIFRHLLGLGHNVLALDSNPTELRHVISQIEIWNSTGKGKGDALKCDLRNRDEIKRFVAEADKLFKGRLDVLVNNAFATPHIWSDGRAMDDESEDIMEQWDTKIAVGLTAPFLLSRLCVPLLKKGDTDASPGCIVNVSSTRAYQSEINHEGYSAAKAGLLGLTQSMSVSLGHKHKIRVNAIIPGWIHVDDENKEADEKRTKWEDALGEEDANWHPAGRVGKVEDVCKALEYLIGAEFVTGQEVVVDGGVGRKMVYPE